MMKTVKLLAAVTVVAMAGWACNTTDSETAREDVTFQTTQSTYALGDTVQAILQNGSSSSIMYGNPFQVQQRTDGKWKSIGPNVYFTLEAITLSPGDKTAYRFILADSSDFFPDYSFSEGQYRVTTSVGVQDKNPSVKTPPFRVSTPGRQ